MKYGVFYFNNTQNIGDDVWAYAQSRFYPSIDYLIDNTSVYKFVSKDGEDVASIMGAFIEPYNCEYCFYMPDNIIPLFVGSYFRPTMYEYLETEYVKKYLAAHSPIGCRSRELADYFNQNGIEAFFSGCVSLTLPYLNRKKEKYICLVDVPEYVVDYVKKEVGDDFEIKIMTHNISDVKSHSNLPIEDRFKMIQDLLDVYAAAHCVVTSRLHVALPCLTQKTPVLLTITHEEIEGVNHISRRIKRLFPMLHHNYHRDFQNGNIDYDFVNPPENPDVYLKYRNRLEKLCNEFIRKCENGECKSRVSGNKTYYDNEFVDALEQKVIQLKKIVDSKNYCIAELSKKTEKQKNSILSLQNRLRNYESFNEWEAVEYFGDWEGRSAVMGRYISGDCRSLLDIGCGEMHIKKYLPRMTKYYGCDYKKRESDTIVCDLSQGQFPSLDVDVIFAAGVIEYLTNWRDVIRSCAMHCRQIIMSYSTSETAPVRNPIWVNCISYDEIVEELSKNGFEMKNHDIYMGVCDIFEFVKTDI